VFRGKRHPSDDALVRRYMADRGFDALQPEDERVVRHVETCAPCGVRYHVMKTHLDGTAVASLDAADAVFTEERLAHQHERIMRRIDVHGARVLPFPVAEPDARASAHSPSVSRWVAAAAAAGLLVGLTAGRVWHLGNDTTATQTAGSSATAPADVNGRGQVITAALARQDLDNAFLSEVEMALSSPRTPELRAIDSLTLEVSDTARAPR
jgi:hypothetical protein